MRNRIAMVAALLMIGILLWVLRGTPPGSGTARPASPTPAASGDPRSSRSTGNAAESKSSMVRENESGSASSEQDASADASPVGDEDTTLRVLDLSNGRPAAGVALFVRYVEPEEKRSVRTDADGNLRIRGEGFRSATAREDTWGVPPQDVASVLASGVLWIHPMVELRGRIVAQETAGRVADLTETRVSLLGVGVRGASSGNPSSDPWNETWLATHDLDALVPPGKVGADGRFRWRIPVTRGLVLHAKLVGWQSASVELESLEFRAGVGEVVLTLAPAGRVTGRVVDAEGRPVERFQVVASIVRRVPEGEFDASRLRLEGFGVKACVSNGTVHIIQVSDATVAGDGGEAGSFALDLPGEGELTLNIYPESDSLLPAVVNVGLPDRGEDVVSEVVLESRTPGARVQILAHGLAVPGIRVSLADLSAGVAQPTFTCLLDERSEMPTHLLRTGSEYFFTVEDRRTREEREREPWFGHFTWSGQATLDPVAMSKRR